MRVKQVVVYQNEAQFTFWTDDWTFDAAAGQESVVIPLATQFVAGDCGEFRASVVNKSTGVEDRSLCKVTKTGVETRSITREARIAGLPQDKRKLYDEIIEMMKQLARLRAETSGIDMQRKALEKLAGDVVDPKALSGPFHMGHGFPGPCHMGPGFPGPFHMGPGGFPPHWRRGPGRFGEGPPPAEGQQGEERSTAGTKQKQADEAAEKPAEEPALEGEEMDSESENEDGQGEDEQHNGDAAGEGRRRHGRCGGRRGGRRSEHMRSITKLVSSVVDETSVRINDGALRKCDLQIEIERLAAETLAKMKDLDGDNWVDLSRGWDALSDFRQQYECRPLFKAHDLVIQVTAAESEQRASPEDLCLKIEITSHNAGWEPQYRFKFVGEKLEQCEVEYHSEVLNNTGYDWVDCDIHLSTGNPADEQEPPAPKKTVLSLQAPPPPQGAGYLFGAARNGRVMHRSMKMKKKASRGRETSFGNVRSTLPAGVSLKTQRSRQKVYMDTFELSAVLYHHIVPEGTMAAYRVFCLSNTSPHTLYQTTAAEILLDGKLVGRSVLADNYVPGAQLSLYAGVDAQVGVKSVSDDRFNSTGGNFITGNVKRRAVNTALEITNFHQDHTVTCLVSHNLPASINSQVKVTMSNAAAAKTLKEYAAEQDPVAAYNLNTLYLSNPTTGSVIERVLLKPAQAHTSAFGYTIDWSGADEIEVSG